MFIGVPDFTSIARRYVFVAKLNNASCDLVRGELVEPRGDRSAVV